MTVDTIDPQTIAAELAGKLSARTRHVCTLLGAGASRSAGLPDLKGLQEAVLKSTELNAAQQKSVKKLLTTRNLEETLSYLRRLVAILEDGQSLGDFNKKSANDLQLSITKAIIPALDHATANLQPFRHFASWVSGAYYRLPIEVFTINYDLLLEIGFEDIGVPYFDGFVGSIHARFRPELVDRIDSTVNADALPPSFVRLWKLHGSVNWEESASGATKRIVRRGTPIVTGAMAAIYPSDEKYDQSRRVPFVVLMDRLRRALAVPETVTLVAGYAFQDQHLNEILFDAARFHPRSETVVFCFDAIPPVLSDVACSTRNMCILGSEDAIIGGRRMTWARADELPDLWEKSTFLLPDFKQLAQFLATNARIGDLSAES